MSNAADHLRVPQVAGGEPWWWWQSQPKYMFVKSHIAFFIASTLDVFFTWVVLNRGGEEVNPVAAVILDNWGENGFFGLSLYKYALVLLVVIICENVGRRRYRTGQKLAIFAVAITCVPVVVAIVQLVMAARAY